MSWWLATIRAQWSSACASATASWRPSWRRPTKSTADGWWSAGRPSRSMWKRASHWLHRDRPKSRRPQRPHSPFGVPIWSRWLDLRAVTSASPGGLRPLHIWLFPYQRVALRAARRLASGIPSANALLKPFPRRRAVDWKRGGPSLLMTTKGVFDDCTQIDCCRCRHCCAGLGVFGGFRLWSYSRDRHVPFVAQANTPTETSSARFNQSVSRCAIQTRDRILIARAAWRSLTADDDGATWAAWDEYCTAYALDRARCVAFWPWSFSLLCCSRITEYSNPCARPALRLLSV